MYTADDDHEKKRKLNPALDKSNEEDMENLVNDDVNDKNHKRMKTIKNTNDGIKVLGEDSWFENNDCKLEAREKDEKGLYWGGKSSSLFPVLIHNLFGITDTEEEKIEQLKECTKVLRIAFSGGHLISYIDKIFFASKLNIACARCLLRFCSISDVYVFQQWNEDIIFVSLMIILEELILRQLQLNEEKVFFADHKATSTSSIQSDTELLLKIKGKIMELFESFIDSKDNETRGTTSIARYKYSFERSCQLCLGILQNFDCNNDHTINIEDECFSSFAARKYLFSAVKEIKKQGYKLDPFNFSLTPFQIQLPIHLEIRQFSFYCYLQNCMNRESLFGIKEDQQKEMIAKHQSKDYVTQFRFELSKEGVVDLKDIFRKLLEDSFTINVIESLFDTYSRQLLKDQMEANAMDLCIKINPMESSNGPRKTNVSQRVGIHDKGTFTISFLFSNNEIDQYDYDSLVYKYDPNYRDSNNNNNNKYKNKRDFKKKNFYQRKRAGNAEKDTPNVLCTRNVVNLFMKKFENNANISPLVQWVEKDIRIKPIYNEKDNFVGHQQGQQLSCQFKFCSETLYLTGYYNKFGRSTPQSAWTDSETGNRVGTTLSVEESLALPLNRYFYPINTSLNATNIEDDNRHRCKINETSETHQQKLEGSSGIQMIASGREDMDVRMLGEGRPLAILVKNPKFVPKEYFLWKNLSRSRKEIQQDHKIKIQKCIKSLEDMVNNDPEITLSGHISLKNLAFASIEKVEEIKATVEEKKKTYACVVYMSKPHTYEQLCQSLHAENDLIIHQSTPLRVLHRRSLLSRPKIIHWLKVKKFINPHFFVLLLNTSSGTYIKEFVHGDLGRTCPSLGSLLGCKTDILQLDVMDVHFEEKEEKSVGGSHLKRP